MKNKNYGIYWIQICPFERVGGGILKPNRDDYPYRLCVVDEKKEKVVDVNTMHEYDYVQISSIYFMHEEAKKIELGKRYAIIKLPNFMFPVSDEESNLALNIIRKMEAGYGFIDGNVFSNEDYLKIVKNEEDKVKRKEKRGYYEHKGNYNQKKKW